jgi:hypothetical protein
VSAVEVQTTALPFGTAVRSQSHPTDADVDPEGEVALEHATTASDVIGRAQSVRVEIMSERNSKRGAAAPRGAWSRP